MGKKKKPSPSASTVAEVERKTEAAESAKELSPDANEPVEKSLVKSSSDEAKPKPQ